MVWIGAISYSLYLWHWPVVVFGRKLGYFESQASLLFAVLVSFVLAAVTYRFVELPFLRLRIPNSVSKARVAGPTAMLMCLVVLVGLSYVSSAQSLNGLQSAAGPTLATVTVIEVSPGKPDVEPAYPEQLGAWQAKIDQGLATHALEGRAALEFGNLASQWVNFPFDWKAPNQQRTAYILGDSMSERANGILFQSLDPKIWSIATRRIGPAADQTFFPGLGLPVEQQNAALQEIAREKPDLVVLIDGRNSLYGNSPDLANPKGQSYRAWASIVSKLRQSSREVVVLGSLPRLPKQLVDCVSRQLTIDRFCKGSVDDLVNTGAMEQAAVTSAGGVYLKTSAWLCLHGSCPPVIGGDIVYLDGIHWSNLTVKSLSSLFKAELRSTNRWPK
jgi:hypothetical protein